MIEIEDEHIKEAESLLIGGKEFDKIERVPFIKYLDSCDLLAVPGSGKTTALLAKLYCLSKQLPFNDGSGILILSHTNAAVDEIQKNLRHVCPKLFEYPNFVGTVQTFINMFLVKPYYSQVLGYKGLRINEGLYFKEIENALLLEFSSEVGYFKNKNKNIFYNSRFWLDNDQNTILSNGISQTPLKLNIPKKWITEGSNTEKEKKVID